MKTIVSIGALSCLVAAACDLGGSVPSGERFCGDGIAQGWELCDRADLRGRTCASILGAEYHGVLECTRQCTFDIGGCERQGSCGDGVVDPGEACDDGNLVDCDGCSADCQMEPAPQCGNDVRECGEACDGEDFGGATCRSLGFASGDLACTGSCEVSAAPCLPLEETLLARDQVDPEAVALAANVSHVYWLNQGRRLVVGTQTVVLEGYELMMVHTVGEPPALLAEGKELARSLTVDDRYVYWGHCAEGVGTMQKMALQGRRPIFVAEASGCPRELHASQTGLYWIAGDRSVLRAAPDGDGITAIYAVTEPAWVGAIALDADYLYLTESPDSCGLAESRGAIRRVSLAAGLVETLAEDICCSHALAVDAKSLYFAACGELLKAPLAGGAPVTLTDLGGARLRGGLVVDGAHAFFPRSAATGGGLFEVDVMKVPVAGGAPWSIVREPGLTSFAIGPGHVFWTLRGPATEDTPRGEVWKALK